jgi:hypothetical protein
LLMSFPLAAVQVLPTWELKQRSQRDEAGADHDPGYGHIPPWYLTQIVAPWMWYPEDMDPDQALRSIHWMTSPSATNKVEAHLYFGMMPLLLILYRLVLAARGSALDIRHRHWLLLGAAAMVYTTGVALPLTRHLPGFSFFMGPGRYGIVTTMSAAILAGAGADALLQRQRRLRSLSFGLLLAFTLIDLHWVSRRVTYAVMIEDPPIRHFEQSEIRGVLKEYLRTHGPRRGVRMHAPGPNFATLTGFSAYPQYLGLGPAAYFDPSLTLVKQAGTDGQAEALAAARRDFLEQGAFTHILSLEPIDAAKWPDARLVWQGVDQVLNRVYAHRGVFSLYELIQTLPRVRATPTAEILVQPHHSGAISVQVSSPSELQLAWADLAYPGWTAEIVTDGESRHAATSEGLFRTISLPPGESVVRWEYQPTSVSIGRTISLISLGLLGAVCAIRCMRQWKTSKG